ncbi:hypothetical protein K8P10_000860 [Leucobacter sp. Psy1]|uniref:DUF6325 family protein n=1 Tax=Leucobacter sp. Psy1 TaxID=2875729 RepID=UPI001CD5B9D7|nr:DUF6325 family protein [Leucobacter sp. Psy1]UBH05349.1 hypothetical protein K8P10_000860 [Leucobacter sp. Psy1]
MGLGAAAANTGVSFGPLEIEVVAVEDSSIAPSLLRAVSRPQDRGCVKLLDFVIASIEPSGSILIHEVDQDELMLADLEPYALGILSEDDLCELLNYLPSGSVAMVLVFEVLWSKDLADRLALEGSALVASVRVPSVTVVPDVLQR